MKVGQRRTKGLFMWLHPDEYEFLKRYAEKNYLTLAEIMRGWIHALMRKEGIPLGEITLPDEKPKRRK